MIQAVLIGAFTIVLIVGLLGGDEDERGRRRDRRGDRWWDWGDDGGGDGGDGGGD